MLSGGTIGRELEQGPWRDTPSHTTHGRWLGLGFSGPIEQGYFANESPKNTGNVYGTQSKTYGTKKKPAT